MNKFSGSQMLDLLNEHSLDRCFRMSSTKSYEYFAKFIYLSANWTQWFKTGVISGALEHNRLSRLYDNNLGEFQCLQYHLCLKEESLRVRNELQ